LNSRVVVAGRVIAVVEHPCRRTRSVEYTFRSKDQRFFGAPRPMCSVTPMEA